MKEELSPLQKIVAARNLCIATIYLCNGMATRGITLGLFNEPIIFAPNSERIGIRENTWNEHDLL